MKLLRLGKLRYEVYAVYDHNDDCPILESLEEISRSNRAAIRMLNKLREIVPESGPNFRNPQKVKSLRGVQGIFEFREQPSKGPKLRVLFFMDGNRVVVCTNAFEKKSKTPPAELKFAEQMRNDYFEAKRQNKLVVEMLEGE